MKRLTRKSLEYKDTWIADGYLSNIDGVIRGQAINKLAELEDLMEDEGFDSIEHFQRFVFEYRAENEELKNHTKDLNDKMLNLQLFLKNLRDTFHEKDEVYQEIDKKLKELGGKNENE